MNAADLVKALNGCWHGSHGTVRCPAHDDQNPSLSVSERNGKVLVKCHAGCPQEDVIRALREAGLWDVSQHHSKSNSRPHSQSSAGFGTPEPEHDERRCLEIVKRILHETQTIRDTPAESYFNNRGLREPYPESLRYHPSCWHGPSGLNLPALIAKVTLSPTNKLVALQRTYLTKNGDKADVQPQRMMLGRCAGGAVRLALPGEKLAIAEGIETGLSVQQSTGVPTWATLSTSGLKSVVLPTNVKVVIICADGDDPGECAAQDAALRLAAEGRTVRIARPPRGHDFNDLLLLPDNVVPLTTRQLETDSV